MEAAWDEIDRNDIKWKLRATLTKLEVAFRATVSQGHAQNGRPVNPSRATQIDTASRDTTSCLVWEITVLASVTREFA